MKYLLDTHAWIWWNMNPRMLSSKARSVISDATRIKVGAVREPPLLLSAISLWEFCKLLQKGRLCISIDPEQWIETAMEIPGLRLVPLTPSIAYASTVLPEPFHEDPADQIITATAREENATVITKDKRILKYGHVRSLW